LKKGEKKKKKQASILLGERKERVPIYPFEGRRASGISSYQTLILLPTRAAVAGEKKSTLKIGKERKEKKRPPQLKRDQNYYFFISEKKNVEQGLRKGKKPGPAGRGEKRKNRKKKV